MVNAPRHKVLLWGWVLHLAVTPFYVFPSGSPQPADALMALLMVCLATGLFARLPRATDLYVCVAIFLLIVVNVNLFWFTIHSDSFFWKSSLFYVFNAGVMISTIVLFSAVGPERMCRLTAYGIVLSVLIEIVVALAIPGFQGIRGVGTFNNPNQLGYWCLISGACWLVVRGEDRLDLLDVAVLAALGYLITLSLSKASMAGFILLVLFAIVAHGLRGRWTAGVAGALLLCLPIVIIQPSLLTNTTEAFFSDGTAALLIERFESIGRQQDDSLAGRGYDRIWLYPGYLFFGAGEGAYERFSMSALSGIELHSSWATLLFSYGIVGLLAFLSILWATFRRAPLRFWLYFLPIAAYGLTHQGLRFSLLWVFCGLVYGVSRYALAVPAGATPIAPAAPYAGRARRGGEAGPAPGELL